MANTPRSYRGRPQEKFGKPGKKYPQADKSFPVIVEQNTLSKGGTGEPAFGDAHPEYASAVVVDIDVSPGSDTEEVRTVVHETLPGPWVTTTRLDQDGATVTVKTRRNLVASIATSETLAAGTWTKTTREGTNALVANEVVETRLIPGNAMVSTELNQYGNTVTTTRTMEQTAAIATSESVEGGILTITRIGEPISDLVAWKVVTTQAFPGITVTGATRDFLTGATTDTLAAAGTAADATIDVVRSDVKPLSNVHSQKATETAPFSSTTVSHATLTERGYAATDEVTWGPPTDTPATETHLVQIKRQLETAARARQTKETAENTQPLVKREFNDLGALEVSTNEYCDPATVPTASGDTVQRVAQLSKHQGELTAVVIKNPDGTALSASYVLGYELESVDKSVPSSRARREYYLVNKGTALPLDGRSGNAWVICEFKRYPPNPNKLMMVRTQYYAPPTFEFYKDNGFSFPQWLNSFSRDTTFGERSDYRPSFSVVVPHRIQVSFGFVKVLTTPTKIIEAAWNIYAFTGHGLTDGDKFYITNGSIGIQLLLPTSTPSRSTYKSWIGKEKLVGGGSEPWIGGIYRTEKIYVVMQ